MQPKLFVALQLEVAHHFSERCAAGRTRRLELPLRPSDKRWAPTRQWSPTAVAHRGLQQGNVRFLERSRCFHASPEMTCSTCHDLHTIERPAADYSARRLGCQSVDQCGMVRKTSGRR